MARGDGRVLDRPRGSERNWAIAFYWRGVEVREAVARTIGLPPAKVTRVEAQRLLRRRLKDVREGRYAGPESERLTVAELIERYIQAKRLEGKVTALNGQLGTNTSHAKAALGHIRVVELTPAVIRTWTEERLAAGYERGTVKLWIGYLRAALKWAVKEDRLSRVPYVPDLQVNNTRRVFFTLEEFDRLVVHLRAPLADLVRFGYLTGWRVSEVLGLRWADVDRTRRVIRLADSKNDDGQTLALVGDLWPLFERRWRARIVGRELCPWVFHRHGKPVKTFNWAWHVACRKAGMPERRVFHDFRRTAARDLIEAGADYKTAMGVTRHRSMAVFMRYQIVDQRRTAWALGELQAFRKSHAKAVTDTDTGCSVRRKPAKGRM